MSLENILLHQSKMCKIFSLIKDYHYQSYITDEYYGIKYVFSIKGSNGVKWSKQFGSCICYCKKCKCSILKLHSTNCRYCGNYITTKNIKSCENIYCNCNKNYQLYNAIEIHRKCYKECLKDMLWKDDVFFQMFQV